MSSAYKYLRSEMQSLLQRAAQECDITVVEVVGLLEVVKADLIREVFTGVGRDPGGNEESEGGE